jgi:hypothetical protein
MKILSSTDGLIAERTNAFVTLVFGYSVVSLLFQNKAPFGINAYDPYFMNTASLLLTSLASSEKLSLV